MAGWEVEWFASSFQGAPAVEVVDGIRIVRKGRQWTVHAYAFIHYRRKLRGQFDAVIDQVNTIPFFTPLWADVPVLMMIWQLAREVWWYESRFPLNTLGYLMEPVYLRAYRGATVLTFSQSTVSDLRRLGFVGDITAIPVGIEPTDTAIRSKGTEPSFVYVGRLTPSKRINEVIEALAMFRQTTGTGRLVLIGDGPVSYVRKLMRVAARLEVSRFIELSGWLRGSAKYKRMAESHALLMASAREGWGLVVTECNRCGTPAVVYDVPGLRDSVRHLETGLVVSQNPRSLADGMLQLISDPNLYERLQAAAQIWSRTLTYEASALALKTTITAAIGRDSKDRVGPN
jgi:glycosyltransferase involved in cell wall biosynthesis